MLVRVITYTFTDPRIPGAGEQVYRLVTTLLDPFAYPAKEVAVLYHERWHVELVIDETRTHLRLSARTLRSLTKDRRHSRDLRASLGSSGGPHAHAASCRAGSDLCNPDQYNFDHSHYG